MSNDEQNTINAILYENEKLRVELEKTSKELEICKKELEEERKKNLRLTKILKCAPTLLEDFFK